MHAIIFRSDGIWRQQTVQKVGKFVPDYSASHTGRQYSSFKIFQCMFFIADIWLI
jgi:hypothetical protein